MLASADLAKITKQIQAIRAARENDKSKSGAKRSAKPSLVPAATKPTKPAGPLTAASRSQVAAAIRGGAVALSQGQLAAKLKTSQANIVRLEKGRSLPSTRTLERSAKATGHKLVINFTH